MSDRIGKLPTSIIGSTSSEVRAGHDDEAEGDAQGVVLDAAGLDPAQAAAGLEGRPTEPLTVPSTTSRSNHHMRVRDLARR